MDDGGEVLFVAEVLVEPFVTGGEEPGGSVDIEGLKAAVGLNQGAQDVHVGAGGIGGGARKGTSLVSSPALGDERNPPVWREESIRMSRPSASLRGRLRRCL